MFEEIISKVNKAEKILVYPHVNMDGDCCGSAKALCLAFRKMGKDSFVYTDKERPAYLSFMYDDCFVDEAPFESDLSFAVDLGEDSRLEDRAPDFYKAEATVCIDHHVPGEAKFADARVIDPNASAAGILVFKFFEEMGLVLDKAIAEALYTAILTDTGCFKYSNTDVDTHLTVSKLYAYDIDHVAICNAVYENKPIAQLKLEALAIDRVELLKGGRFALSYISIEDRARFDASYDLTETSVDAIRSIKGAEAVAMIKEKEEGIIKVSFRSKGYVNVRPAAANLGGGGHDKAAACTLNMSLDEAIDTVRSELLKLE
jgi:phosphoesterase RecJ-like protein